MASAETFHKRFDPTLEELDNPQVAAKYLMEFCLTSGSGKALRALKALMDANQLLLRTHLETNETILRLAL